ncbi:tRNA lysidine(34) synthetase TilS [bacterium]|nr:MAG: tRNA lysidine(34) synthetase TilS [bacterium]
MNPDLFNETVSRHLTAQLAQACPRAARPGLLVAVSGGADSTALLLAARHWATNTDSPLAAAHLHHGLRGVEADGDQEFCADLCRRLDVPLHTGHEDPRPLARERGKGLEEAARHLRRRFLAGVLASDDTLHAVATGHHRDDQAETVIMRLMRGTGPDGLAGIRPVAGHWLHPLLTVSRAEILAYLQAAGQSWRHDATNSDGANTRARLRRELLPVARGIFGPGVEAAAARLAELQDADRELLARWTDEALARCLRDEDLDVDTLTALEPALAARVLRIWLGTEDLERVHVEAVLKWLDTGISGTGLDLPDGRRLEREFDLLRRPRNATVPGRNASEYRILVRNEEITDDVSRDTDRPDDESTWSLVCPADVLQGRLRVRNWAEGDRMRPFGLDGTKKLSDLFREKKLPAKARPGLLVVEDDAGILWSVGVARAERTRLLPTTGSAVSLRVVRRQASEVQRPGNKNP